MKKLSSLCGLAFLVSILAASAVPPPQTRIDIRFVQVSGTGNTADSATGHGRVDEVYTIGREDVSVSQYTTFLNAVARKDPYGLYTPEMATNLNVAGILRTGRMGGPYTYSVIGEGRNPIALVSWLDAARFCNWLHNGQPFGAEGPRTTEAGAYTLNGDMSAGLETRNTGATYWLPTLDEWYKAAYYHDVFKIGAQYYDYPTGTSQAPGNLVTSTSNSANYQLNGVYAVTQSSVYSASQNYLTRLGLFRHSRSPSGTLDQGGDVAQWTDTTNPAAMNATRFTPGGAWDLSASNMMAQTTYLDKDPAGHYADVGFRVASTAVPIFAGNYAGLTSGSDGIFFAAIQKDKSFSADFTLGPKSYLFSGHITPELTYNHTYTAGGQSLVVDFTMSVDSIRASFGLGGLTYDATAHRDPNFLQGYPTRDAGSYNLLLLSGTDPYTSNNDGFGHINISPEGVVRVTGKLADGSPFSAGSLSTGCGIPIFTPDTKYRDGLAGVIEIRRGDPCATVRLVQPAGVSLVDLIGSAYVEPKPNIRTWDFLDVAGNGIFNAWGPGQTYLAENIFTLGANNKISLLDTGPGSPLIHISPGTGAISGRFWDTAFQEYVPFSGVVLQSQNIGGGFFQPGGASGNFLLYANPQFGTGVAGYGLGGVKSLPKVEIDSPPSEAKIDPATHTSINFFGTASATDGIQSVSYQVAHNGQVTDEITALGTTQWSFTVTPAMGATGTYTVYVRATDADGNQSELVPRTVTYSP